MKKFILLSLIYISIGLISCSKIIDLEPISEISDKSFWKTESDAQGAVAGMYVLLRGQSTHNLYLWGESRSEIMGPNVAATVFQNWYQNALNPETSGSIFTGAPTNWGGMYSVLHMSNLIIENVPKITFASEISKNNILGQAHAMRAYIYFVLVRTFGGAPIVSAPVSGQLGGELQKAKNSPEEVFEFIKSEIDQALTLFSNETLPAGRNMWSRPSVNTLKADVYLWTAKRLGGGRPHFEMALAACQAAEQASVSLLPDFSNVFKYGNKGNNEILMAITRKFEETTEPSIFAWASTSAVFYPPTIDAETRALVEPTGGAPYWSPSTIARAKFTDDDKRKKASIIEIYGNEGGQRIFHSAVIGKFTGTVISGTRYFIDDYIIYRFADILLMKAEAKNALDQDPSTEINLIRRRAYGDAYPNHIFANSGKVINDQAILDERLKELMFEGKRWWDLIRFGKAFELVPSLQGRQNDTYLLLFPIPTATLSLNSKLTQNDGYSK